MVHAAWYVGWIIGYCNHGMRLCVWGELLVIGFMVCCLVCGVNYWLLESWYVALYVGWIIGYWFHGMRLGLWGELLVIGIMVCSLVCGVNYWLLVSWYAAWYVGWRNRWWLLTKTHLAASLWRIHFYHVSLHCLLITYTPPSAYFVKGIIFEERILLKDGKRLAQDN